jgi:hypothetical protein
MALYKRPKSSFWWVRFMLAGREVRRSTGTANKKQAIEFESAQRGEAWRQRKLGERPPYPWADAKTRWLAETQKRSKRRDVDILAWFDEHLDGEMVQDITREVIEELRALRAKQSSKATADRFMCLLRASCPPRPHCAEPAYATRGSSSGIRRPRANLHRKISATYL